MQDLINIFTGNIAVFGYSVPTAWLITGALFLLAAGVLVAAGVRSVMLTTLAGMMLFTLYFVPMMTGG